MVQRIYRRTGQARRIQLQPGQKMPLIIHILEEDLAGWELTHQSARAYHYRPRLAPCAWRITPDRSGAVSLFGAPVVGMSMIAPELAEQIQIVSPARLEDLAGQDMFCHINVEKGWMSKKVGFHPEIKFQLKALRENIHEGRRLRIRIKEIDQGMRPPRVILEELSK